MAYRDNNTSTSAPPSQPRAAYLVLVSSQETIPPAAPPRGVGFGRREFRPSGYRQPHAFRDACKAVSATADALNARLPCECWESGRVPGDHPPLDSEETRQALHSYKMACAKLIDASTQPKHIPDMLRALGELTGLGDPVWVGGPFDRSGSATVEQDAFAGTYSRLSKIIRSLEQSK